MRRAPPEPRPRLAPSCRGPRQCGGEVGLVDDEEIALHDPRSALSWDVLALGHRDHVEGVIGKFGIERRREVVTTALDEDEIEVGMIGEERIDLRQIYRRILTDASMRARTGLDTCDQIRRDQSRKALTERVGVLLGQDIVGDHAHVKVALGELWNEFGDECGFARSHGTTDPNRCHVAVGQAHESAPRIPIDVPPRRLPRRSLRRVLPQCGSDREP